MLTLTPLDLIEEDNADRRIAFQNRRRDMTIALQQWLITQPPDEHIALEVSATMSIVLQLRELAKSCN